MNTSNKLKIGVVGVGVMGAYHAQNYALLPDVALVGVSDISAMRRSIMEREFNVPAYSRPEDLLGHVDAVTVASPTTLHYEHVRMFLENDVHVLVEKPITPTLEQAKKLVAIAEERNLVFQVGHVVRFYSAISDLKRKVSNPWLVEFKRLGNNKRIRDIDVVLDLMIHDLDLAISLFQERPNHINAVGHEVDGYLDFAHAMMDFPSGARAVFTASRVSPLQERSVVVTQAGKMITLNFKNDVTESAVYKFPEAIESEEDVIAEAAERTRENMERISIQNDNPLRRQLRHFVDRILYKVKPVATLEDDINVLELALRLTSQLKIER